MRKSVYSIVLTDDVVEAIDRLAYSMGTSRSNLINQILAERIAYETPEKRMSDIFTQIQSIVSDDCFRIIQQQSDAMLSIRSALKYRYNPIIRYGIELFRQNNSTIGEIKVTFRTQSEQLIQKMNSFLRMWVVLENRYISEYFPDGIIYNIERGKFTRTFRLPKDKENLSTSEIGNAIGEYIKMFDKIIKLYFACDDEKEAMTEVKDAYVNELKNGAEII